MPATKFEKGKVKEKIDPKVLSALSTAFGYKVDDVDDLDYEEYHNELREAIQIGKESLSSAEMGLLVMERKRIRSEKSVYKEDFKEKKTIMTAADIKKGSAMQLAENSALSLYKGGVGQSPEETDENLVDIEDKLDDILESLKEEGKLGKDQAAAAKKKAEQEKRAKKEKNLERWTALKKTTSKVLKPFRSIWDKIFGFLKTILLGSALFNIIKWMGDPKNQDKLNNIFRFFKDWWPTLLAAYLLFGNAFGRMAVKLGVMVSKFAVKLLTKLIPKLLAGLAKIKAGSLLKGGLVAGALVGAGVGIHQIGKMMNKDKEAQNLAEAQNQSREAIVDEGNVDEGEAGVLSQSVISSDITQGNVDEGEADVLSQSVTTENVDRMTQGDTNLRSNNNMLQTGMDDPLGGGRFGFNKGGSVPGSGNKDTVPAMLTPGEFVMTKGAVHKYGENTLAGMNAAAGGTNRPTLMRGYNEGGAATPMSTEDLVAAVGPSLDIWMEQHNAAIDSDPDAIFGEHMRVTMDRDGKMPNFGKTIANMSEWAFNQSVQMTQENDAIPPEAKEAILNKMMFIRRGTLENPNFKADLAFDINKDIPGTAAHRLFLRAQADTTSPAAMAGLSARDRALQMNRMGYSGGGLVQAFQGGGSVGFFGGMGNIMSGKTWGGQDRVKPQRGRGQGNKIKAVRPNSKQPNIGPSEKKKVTVAYEEEKKKSAAKTKPTNSEQKIPNFDVTASRSPQKIKVLGISV